MASAAKRAKLSAAAAATTSESNSSNEEFMKKVQKTREETAKSILEYKFNKKRVRIISQEQMVPDYCEGIVYWMFRDSRVQDNWAFLFAQNLALKNEVPLHVCFCLISEYLDTSVRQFHFLLKGKWVLKFRTIPNLNTYTKNFCASIDLLTKTKTYLLKKLNIMVLLCPIFRLRNSSS